MTARKERVGETRHLTKHENQEKNDKLAREVSDQLKLPNKKVIHFAPKVSHSKHFPICTSSQQAWSKDGGVRARVDERE